MKILVASRQSVCVAIKKLQIDEPDNNVIVISITDPKSEPVNLPLRDFSILRLSFHDLDQTYPISGPAIILFNTDMAQQIKDFIVNQLCERGLQSIQILGMLHTTSLIIHCEAGISRSAGVAGALSKYILGDDSQFFRTPYLPNRLVYKTLLNLLNGQENPIPNTIIGRGFDEDNGFF